MESINVKKKKFGVCNIKIGQSYTFKDSKNTFIINKNLSCNSKNVILIIECENCKQTFIGFTKDFNTRISLHKSNIKIEINRKLNIFLNVVIDYLKQCQYFKQTITIYYKSKKMILLKNTHPH